MAGIIAGFVMLVLLIKIFSYMNTANDQEITKRNFAEIVANAKSICDSSEDKITKTMAFPSNFEIIYSTNDNRFVNYDQRTFGKYICISFAKESVCEEMKCDIEMTPITPSKNLQTLMDRILGKSEYMNFVFEISKTYCGVSVLTPGETTECM
jgi:hypothetical protein